MALVVLALSVLVAVVGAVGIVVPASLLAIAGLFVTPVGIYAAAAFRLVLGTAVVVAAPASRTPTTLRVLGAVIIVGGLVTPSIGVERARMFVAWWATQGSAFLRVWVVIALAFGWFFAYVTAPRARRLDQSMNAR